MKVDLLRTITSINEPPASEEPTLAKIYAVLRAHPAAHAAVIEALESPSPIEEESPKHPRSSAFICG